jgi:formate dehydrogenase (hydrogenase)
MNMSSLPQHLPPRDGAFNAPRDARTGKSRGMKSSSLTRITHPMVRENGVLRRASWEEAMTRAAAGFVAARDTQGRNSVGVFSCSKSTNEMNFIAQKWIRAVIGSNNIDSCNRT